MRDSTEHLAQWQMGLLDDICEFIQGEKWPKLNELVFIKKKIMSDFDRRKFSSSSKPPKLYSAGESTSKRRETTKGFSSKESGKDSSEIKIKQPTILIKAREHSEGSPKRKPRDPENMTQNVNVVSKENEAPPVVKKMKSSVKLMDDGTIRIDALQDYMQEHSDFLVVGVIGAQGVGKTTILNMLANNQKKLSNKNSEKLREQFEKLSICEEIFEIETLEDIENCRSRTQGIDMYITSNRVIYLDCQPFLSVTLLDQLIECETKRSNLISEFIPLENSGEIQALQYTSFLMCVCHILLVVQDWFFDSNIVRFLQTAEMLKPTISNPEDEFLEHFPHLVLIHNRAEMGHFTPSEFKNMQKVYHEVFHNTKLQIQSNIGMGSGRLINTLNPENCGSPMNLFLIPEFNSQEEPVIYRGYPPLDELINKLRALLYGSSKNSLTHVQLTEKTWLMYCSKVWETVKKSPFFVEYSKLMP